MSSEKKKTRLAEKTEKRIQDSFFEGGKTASQVARELHCDHKTITTRWNDMADTIVLNADHEDWYQREERARTRALEDLSCQVTSQRKTLEPQVKVLDELDTTIENLENWQTLDQMVRKNRNRLSELIDQYDAIEMTPPMRIILEKETEVRIAAKQGITAKQE